MASSPKDIIGLVDGGATREFENVAKIRTESTVLLVNSKAILFIPMSPTGSDPRHLTPPHHPIFGVTLPRETIERVFSELIQARQLEAGRSYNNRIYFLKLRHLQSGEVPGGSDEQDVVLKVNGRFFGADKIQNEVACLRLLNRHCPNIPAPDVLAWSEDGENATVVAPAGKSKFQKLDTSRGRLDQSPSHVGWILMSKAAGEPLSALGPDDAMMAGVAIQLADMVACWRSDIPSQKRCGNIRFRSGEYQSDTAESFLGSGPDTDSSGFVVRGILGEGIKLSAPLPDLGSFYRVKMEDKLGQLESGDTYRSSRALAQPLRAFLADTLPRLTLGGEPQSYGGEAGSFVFTHYDLSPRNVLVSGQPPRITGIVDFEFAGFFSPLDEFLNDHVGNKGDWPRAAYDAYLEKLEERQIATPAKSIDGEVWKQALRLETLVDNIAPWWLPGEHKGVALEHELKMARDVVRETMEELSQSISRSV